MRLEVTATGLSQTASFIMLLKHVAAGSSEAVIIAQIQTSWSKFVRLYMTRRIFCRRHKAFFLDSSVLQNKLSSRASCDLSLKCDYP